MALRRECFRLAVEERADLALQELQLVVCPHELPFDAFKCRGHPLPSLPSTQMPFPRKFKAKPGQPTQKTQPKGIDPQTGKRYEPIEIPVPTREDVLGSLRHAARSPRNTAADRHNDGWRLAVSGGCA